MLWVTSKKWLRRIGLVLLTIYMGIALGICLTIILWGINT